MACGTLAIVMVNFMVSLTGLGVLGLRGRFWMRLAFEWVDTADSPSQCGWASSKAMRACIEQKSGEKKNSPILLPAHLPELGHSSSALGQRLTPVVPQFYDL